MSQHPRALANELLRELEGLKKSTQFQGQEANENAELNLRDFIYKATGVPFEGYHDVDPNRAFPPDGQPWAAVHGEMIDVLQNPTIRYICFLIARQHAKSTIESELYPAWEIIRNPSVRIMVISYSKGLAVSAINSCSDYLEQLGVKFEKNDEEEKTVMRPKTGLHKRDPTLLAMSTASKVIGRHADIMILDDTVTLENCFDNQTEILTVDGWKYFKDVTYEDSLFTLNIETQIIEIQQPTNIIREFYNGDMIGIKTGRVDLLVTPNHNLLLRDNGVLLIDAAENRYGQTGARFKKDGIWKGENIIDYEIPEYENIWVNKDGGVHRYYIPRTTIPISHWVAFLGIYISEGSVSKNGRERYKVVQISQKNHVGKIREILKNLPYEINEFVEKSDGMTRFNIYSTQLAEHLAKLGGSYKKYIPNYIKSLSPELLEVLLDSLMLGDGYTDKNNSSSYTTVSKRLAGDIQEIALKIGRSATIHEYYYEPKQRIQYKVVIYKERWCEPGIYSESNWYKTPYNDMVGCVTVPNHTIYVRRGGQPVWSSQSYTPYQREKYEEWFNAVIGQVLESTGRLVVTGVRWRNADWHGVLSDPVKHPEFKDGTLVRPACTREFEKVLWKRKWNAETLRLQQLKIGPLHFASQFLLDPSGLEGGSFKLDWIFGEKSSEYDELPPLKYLVLGVDPSLGVGANMFVICVAGVGVDNKLYVMSFLRQNITTGEQPGVVLNEYKRLAASRIGIETVAYQVALKNEIEKRAKEQGVLVNVEPFQGTAKKELRLQELGGPLFSGLIRFPKSGHLPWKPYFIEEYAAFPSGDVDDMLDGLYYAFKAAHIYNPVNTFENWEPVVDIGNVEGRKVGWYEPAVVRGKSYYRM